MWDFMTLLDSRTRRILMLHELFHRIQNELGLNVAGGPARAGNEHLDTRGASLVAARVAALARALSQSGEQRKRAVSDAAAFRLMRRSQFANAAENERVEEIREGLAQYTGTVVTRRTLRQSPVCASNWPRPNSTRRSCSKHIQLVWRTGFFSILRRRIGGKECAATPISGRC